MMLISMSHDSVVMYPQDIVDWQAWIIHHLDLDILQVRSLMEEGNFPFARLIAVWQKEFSSERGYSPNFIPALTRNKVGFVRWVYLQGSEPNWKKTDDEQ